MMIFCVLFCYVLGFVFCVMVVLLFVVEMSVFGKVGDFYFFEIGCVDVLFESLVGDLKVIVFVFDFIYEGDMECMVVFGSEDEDFEVLVLMVYEFYLDLIYVIWVS